MRALLFAIACYGTMALHAQPIDFPKNTISLESGVYHRGHAGISYARHLMKSNLVLISTELFAGAEFDEDYFAGGGLNLSVGRAHFFLNTGVDLQYARVTERISRSEDTSIYPFHHYRGITAKPWIGAAFYANSGLSCQLRLGYLAMHGDQGNYVSMLRTSTLGISVGYSF